MKQNTKQETKAATTPIPKLRLVAPEELAGLPNTQPAPHRHRSHLAEQLNRYCDELDREIERLLRL